MTALLEVSGLSKTWPARGGEFGLRRANEAVAAVDGISLTLERGGALALVGESGCGKTTTAQCVLGLERPDAGRVLVDGVDVHAQRGRSLRQLRRRMQLVYQDPYESLDPRQRVIDILEEPLRIHKIGTDRPERLARAVEALEAMDLRPAEAFLSRRPHELSGGQRQRIAIAASLVLDPDLLIADEPVSMLDVSLRSGVLAAIAGLRHDRGLALLIITHDLSTVPQIADRIAVMYRGAIVETGDTRSVLRSPRHPYTQALIRAVPSLRRSAALSTLAHADPEIDPRKGCRFAPRCGLRESRCLTVSPELCDTGDDREVACLVVTDQERASCGPIRA